MYPDLYFSVSLDYDDVYPLQFLLHTSIVVSADVDAKDEFARLYSHVRNMYRYYTFQMQKKQPQLSLLYCHIFPSTSFRGNVLQTPALQHTIVYTYCGKIDFDLAIFHYISFYFRIRMHASKQLFFHDRLRIFFELRIQADHILLLLRDLLFLDLIRVQ